MTNQIKTSREELHEKLISSTTKKIETRIRKGGRNGVNLEILYYEKNESAKPPAGLTKAEIISCLKAALNNSEYPTKTGKK